MTAVSFVGVGTRFVNTNGPVTPGIPAGVVDGDLLIGVVEIHSSLRTYTSPPAGWTYLGSITNSGGPSLHYHWKAYASGDTDPTFAVTGTSDAGKSALGTITGWHNADVTNGPTLGTPYTSGATTGSNAGPIPGVAVTGAGVALLSAAWNDDYTSIPALPSGYTLIRNDEVSTTSGVSYHKSYISVTSASSSAVTVTGHPTAVATRSGVQIAIHEGVQTGSGSLAVAGSGSLNLTGTPKAAGTLAVTGSGSLSLVGTIGGDLSRSGSGTLSFVRGPVAVSGALNVAGSGTLTFAVSSVRASGALVVAGVGALNLSGKPAVNVAFARSGVGTLTLAGTPRVTVGFARSGVGTLTLVGRAIYRHQVWRGDAWREIVPLVESSGGWLNVPVKLVASLRGA